MAESGSIRTYRQGRLWLRKYLPKLKEIKDALSAFEDTLPFPSQDVLDEMLSGSRPVTREAYLCAVVHVISFYAEEAWTEAEQHLERTWPRMLPASALDRYQPGFRMIVRARSLPTWGQHIVEPEDDE